MKTLLTLVMAVLLAVSLSACMTTGAKAPAAEKAPAHLKCPNCGFEFDVGHPGAD